MSWDPYGVLGLPKGADAADIKKAYRKIAKTDHPDVRGDDKVAGDRFKRATAAFNLLSDPEKKARYDRGEIDEEGQERARFAHGGYGGGPGDAQGPWGPRGRGGGQGPGGPEAFEDLFGGMFGGGRGRSKPQFRGSDIRYSVDIDFMDAVTGARRRLQMADGRSLDVSIPAGLKSGQTLRLRSQGQQGMGGGPPGDALLEVTIRPHKTFTRDGNDLRMGLAVSLAEAVEGGQGSGGNAPRAGVSQRALRVQHGVCPAPQKEGRAGQGCSRRSLCEADGDAARQAFWRPEILREGLVAT